ncbi:MAG: Zn-dependent hydrolase [Actinomycetia bacterium]|nr:Zn-dependent hydrolase [Actinomycetes bacterium]
MNVDGSRLLASLRHLATFSRPGPSGAVTRLPWTPEDAAAVRYLAEGLRAAGLHVRQDAIGNLWGTWDVSAPRTIILGSHRDSVPAGGAFDGALGVVAALEVVRRLRETGYRPRHNLEVVAWNDEEGARFGTTLFGSRVFVGALDPRRVADRVDADGVSLGEAAARHGFPVERMLPASDLGHVAAYLELHIEQGPLLEREGRTIGVVSGIGAIYQRRITLRGTRLHAAYSGTDRHDPVLVASGALAALDEAVRAANAGREEARVGATVGMWRPSSELINVVPEEVRFTVDLRGPDPAVVLPILDGFVAEVERLASAAGVEVLLEAVNDHTTLAGGGDPTRPLLFDAALGERVNQAAGERRLPRRAIFSWAGHDAMAMAPRVPTAMIFVPSRRGLSHTAMEYTVDDDVVHGADVLLATLLAVDAEG